MSLFAELALRRSRGKVIQRLADRLGLVHFGTVDHRRDDHEVIRGLTVSATHKDRHFVVGTYDGYDIAIVDRYDQTRTERRNWAIIQVSLHQKETLPHLFFLPHHRGEQFATLFTGVRHMAPIEDIASQEFATRYQLLAEAQRIHHLPEGLTQQMLQGIAAYFWPHALEFKDSKLFVYLTEHRLDETVLESAVKSALWLADLIEAKSLSPYEP